MRDIKFRAWHLGFGRMFINEELISIDFKSKHALLYDQYGWTTFHTLSLMQYTGLKDKSGKEIYEGDLVKYLLPAGITEEDKDKSTEYIEKVVYEDGGFMVEMFPLCAAVDCECAVIGNIYENPALLT